MFLLVRIDRSNSGIILNGHCLADVAFAGVDL